MRDRYGPWALVTGASDGIGQACARVLAREGMNLLLVARRQERLDALAEELQGSHGISARAFAVDLSTIEGNQQLLDHSAALPLGLAVLAAGFGTSGAFVDSQRATEQNMLAVNCLSVLMLSHELADRFAGRGYGGLVLFSSLLAFQGVPRAAHYAATKAYVQTLAEGLHPELKPLGIDVLVAAPGPVSTGFGARANMQMGKALSPDVVARETLRQLGRTVTTRPGWLSVLLEASLTPLPWRFRTAILSKVMYGMTRHHGL